MCQASTLWPLSCRNSQCRVADRCTKNVMLIWQMLWDQLVLSVVGPQSRSNWLSPRTQEVPWKEIKPQFNVKRCLVAVQWKRWERPWAEEAAHTGLESIPLHILPACSDHIIFNYLLIFLSHPANAPEDHEHLVTKTLLSSSSYLPSDSSNIADAQ